MINKNVKHSCSYYAVTQERYAKARHAFTFFVFLCVFIFTCCKKEVSKTDTYTNFGRTYPVDRNQNILGASRTPDNGYLIWGYTDENYGKKQDGFVLRLDAEYNKVWYHTYGGIGDDYISSAVFDDIGNIMAAGFSKSFDISVDSTAFQSSALMYAIYMNDKGDKVWENVYPKGLKQNIGCFLSKVLYLPKINGFALVGNNLNYVRNNFYGSHALIQCVTKQGDTLWNSDYTYWDSSLFKINSPTVPYYGSGATVTKDGDILMAVTTGSGGYNDYIPYSLFRIPSNNVSGTNNQQWRKPIAGLTALGYSAGIFGSFFRNTFVLVDPVAETYLIQNDLGFLLADASGNVKSDMRFVKYNLQNDMQFDNGMLYSLRGFNNNFTNYLTKMDINGTTLWETSLPNRLNANNGFGIFVQPDKSISTFCSILNAQNEMDIALIRINEKGNLILK